NISIIAKMALEHFGKHVVVVAEDGEQALGKALSEPFDLILLDEMMPKMNGVTVCRNYLKTHPRPSPIIFLSAKSQEADIEEFRSLALGHIPKPFEPTQICTQIDRLLQERKVA